MTTQIVSSPIESALYIDEPFDFIRSIAKYGKGGSQFVLKTNKPNHPKTKRVYAFGPGAFYTFDVVKYEKTGYVVEKPVGLAEMPKPEDIVGLRVAMAKVYDAYRKPDLDESCAIRLQELEIESMQRIIKDSTPEQLQRLFDFADEDDDDEGAEDGVEAADGTAEDTAPIDMADTIQELKDAEELDKDSLIEAMNLLNDNFELAKYTLNQIATTRQTVEAYFNMPVGLMQFAPVSVVDALNAALQAALERTKNDKTPTLEMGVGEDDPEPLGK